MKQITLVIVCAVLTAHVSLAQETQVDGAFHTTSIVLYNQMDEFAERSPAAEVLASFIKQLGEKAATLWKDAAPAPGTNGFIAVAIRPDRTMKLWVDVEQEFQSNITASLEREMQVAGVPQVKNAPIAFAVHFSLCGGRPETKANSDGIQIPQLWRRAAEAQSKSLAIPDDILPLVWKAEPSRGKKPAFFVPKGYELQELNPSGGKILRPKGWFYTEGHREHAYMWTISKEDPSKGGYETGVRIQCFVGVQEATGKSPKDFIQSFLDGKKRSASVISQRPQKMQGLFSRVGLETKESVGEKQETYRILYSCFWGNDADIVVICISGTTTDLWEQYSDPFDAMSGFELIDMSRFERGDRTKASKRTR